MVGALRRKLQASTNVLLVITPAILLQLADKRDRVAASRNWPHHTSTIKFIIRNNYSFLLSKFRMHLFNLLLEFVAGQRNVD